MTRYNSKTGKYVIGNLHKGHESDTGKKYGLFEDYHGLLKSFIPDLTIISYHTHPSEDFASEADIITRFNNYPGIDLIGTTNRIYGLFPTKKSCPGFFHLITDEQVDLLDLLKKAYKEKRSVTDEKRIEWARQLGLAPYEGVVVEKWGGKWGDVIVSINQKRLQPGIYLEKIKPLPGIKI